MSIQTRDNIPEEEPKQSITTSSGNKWLSIKSLFKREKRIGIIIDGPNLLRRIGNKQIKVEDIDQVAGKLGSVDHRYICLNQHASDKLIKAMINSGYTPIVVMGDMYVRIAMKAIEIVNTNKVEVMLVGSRDARVVPILIKLKEKGIETAVVGFDPGFSIALKNVADYAFSLN